MDTKETDATTAIQCCAPTCCEEAPAALSFPLPVEKGPVATPCCGGSSADRSGDLQQVVQQKYGEAARQVRVANRSAVSCCGGPVTESNPITSDLYQLEDIQGLPEKALLASLGCGNPTALASLHPGETVLDLGSGGGIDVLLSARRVGPQGKAYGLDMTDEMLALARENQQRSGLTNVEFLKGKIEHIPLPDNSVDVIISNCVINLSADKDQVFQEAFRVLRPGGRLAVSDVVVRGTVPDEIRRNVEMWIGCVAGALSEDDYQAKLVRAGFDGVTLEPTRIYQSQDARELIDGMGLDVETMAHHIDGKFLSGGCP